MGGKEEEETGDVDVKMPESTLKIFSSVQVGRCVFVTLRHSVQLGKLEVSECWDTFERNELMTNKNSRSDRGLGLMRR